MRLLIGSDAPASLGQQADIRAWTQRLLWFARDGDVIVLVDEPDPVFLRHVTGLTGVDPSTLRFHVVPNRSGWRNFDAWSLLEPRFQDALASDVADATEVVALWPCSGVAWLAQSLGIEQGLAGAGFWREGGGVLANSKAMFRALAGGVGVPIAPGGVCRSREDAFSISGHLLQQGHAFVVKRSYGGGGAGNEIVSRQQLDVSHAGHASTEQVEVNATSLRDYWLRRWDWASEDGCRPFVVEAFVPEARTLYVEVSCHRDGVGDGKIGELRFEGGRIASEVFPAQAIPDDVRKELKSAASRLGRAYHAIGYRGRLSLDSVVTATGLVRFTEANARFTTSTHLYGPIANGVARMGDERGRVIVQTMSPATWSLSDLEACLATLARHGLAFDAASRTGVIAVTPVVHGTGQLMLASIADSEEGAFELLALAGQLFSTALSGPG